MASIGSTSVNCVVAVPKKTAKPLHTFTLSVKQGFLLPLPLCLSLCFSLPLLPLPFSLHSHSLALFSLSTAFLSPSSSHFLRTFSQTYTHAHICNTLSACLHTVSASASGILFIVWNLLASIGRTSLTVWLQLPRRTSSRCVCGDRNRETLLNMLTFYIFFCIFYPELEYSFFFWRME